MEEIYILHRKGCAAELVTANQAINNALEQEGSGIIPRYAFRDYKTGENLTPPGVADLVNLCGRLRGRIPSE